MKLFSKTPLLLIVFSIIGFASCKKAKVSPLGKDLVLTASDEQKVTADNAFTINLFKSLDSANTPGANTFASPLSVSFALGMTSNGAKGATYAAFQKTLNLTGLTQQEVNSYYNNLITNLPQLDPNTTLSIANSIWYKSDFSVLPAFLQTNTTYFHAQVQALDFGSTSAPNAINNWVSTQTKGLIPEIIKTIPGDAKMYLVNAMYFKSSWAEKFNPAQTKPMDFYLPDNSTVQANFMTATNDFNYYNDGKVGVYELPYSDDRYSMVIVEPGYNVTLAQTMATVTPVQWQAWMSGLRHTNNSISMPKFKFSYSDSLKTNLTNLGLGLAFTDGADFTLINPDPSYMLHIKNVIHKAFVDVDENGTTAAAATSVGVVGLTASVPPPPINHPFLFAIRQVNSGVILFMGTVNNPLLQGN